MSEIRTIDFDANHSWLDGPLPNPPYPKEPCFPDYPSAWQGIAPIMPALMERFNVGSKCAIEFGVEYGYSTAVLAQLFRCVIGVDTFMGDEHSDYRDASKGCSRIYRENFYEITKKNLEPWPNVILVQSDYRDFKLQPESVVDLIHIDIVHTYQDTFACGQWACGYAPVVIFHDTNSFPTVRQAVHDLADQTGRVFWNYANNAAGLGILVKP